MVRAVTKEVTELDEDVAQILAHHGGDDGGGFDPSAQPAAACALLVDHLCMRRNKRCLLAYHRVRCDKLEEMCWRGVDVDVLEQAGAEDVALPVPVPVPGPHEAPPPPPPPQQQQQQQQQQQHEHQQQQQQQQQEKLADKRQGATGPDGSATAADADGGVGSLSADEEEYVRQYSDLLAAYKGQWTDIDLTGPLEPPRDLFIDVRVLRDAGEIQTEYG
jgi:GINS complex subunit 1